MGGANRPLASLTFEQAPANSTAIYAVSGEVAAETPPSILVEPADAEVEEGRWAEFRVVAVGTPGPRYQWYREGMLLAGATQSVCRLERVGLADQGAGFQVVAANVVAGASQAVTSRVATLTVVADTVAPVLVGARSVGLDGVELWFSEPVAGESASEAAHYTLRGPAGEVEVFGVTLGTTNVFLHVGTMTEGAGYGVEVREVVDLAAARNRVAAGSTASFVVLSYAPADIGGSAPAGDAIPAGGGLDVRGGGRGMGGTRDEFQFRHAPRTGDFDVRVRLGSLSRTDAWASAGLMVRESLAAGSRFAAVLATPGISGAFFESRGGPEAVSVRSGSCPVNYPEMWLRLRRVGNEVTGYAGRDGLRWRRLGSATLVIPASVELGFAVTSRDTNRTAVAAFRDFSEVGAGLPWVEGPGREPLGQSSRRTSLVISEIMYHPPEVRLGERRAELEFVEVCNTRAEREDLGGFRLSGAVDYEFPPGTWLPGGGFLVVARSPADVAAVYGLAGVLGPWEGAETNGLPNAGGLVRVRHRAGAVLLEVEYGDEDPWPVAADGWGHSLVLARPSYGEGDARAWGASDRVLGSPGRMDPWTSDPGDGVVINEFLAHTDDPLLDYIEVFNAGSEGVDLSGYGLTDEAGTNRYRFPAGTALPAGGFLVVNQAELGFALSAEGEGLGLWNGEGTRLLDAVRFGGQENSVATGRVPDGGRGWYALASRSPGGANGARRGPGVVINEVMYHPISGEDDDQFVEVYNGSGGAVDLGGWRLEGGIGFVFPTNTVVAAEGYLVVARQAARLRTNYAGLTEANCVGDFSGRLARGGERVALTKPDTVVSTNAAGTVMTNTIHILVDEVVYATGGRWGRWADGGGSSLERIDGRAEGRLAGSWGESEDGTKAGWTFVEQRGVLDHGNVPADQLQVLLLGAGECLIDEVEVLDQAGVNRIANGTFESGASGWTAQGAESGSGLEAGEGYQGGRSFRIRAVGRGDNQVNRVRAGLTSALTVGTTATIRARVRWLRGHPEIVFRLRGNWLEAAARMATPAGGTPGLRNRRAVVNGGPAVFDVGHEPVLPAGGEAVVVRARVEDPDGVAAVEVRYRVDPGAVQTAVAMRDDGQGGDARAGDGVYSARLPGQAAGVLVAFEVRAADGAAPAAGGRFPEDAPARECLVRFGEQTPTGNYPVYRLWMTQATAAAWGSRLKLDNTPNDVTFVVGGDRVIYNAQARFAGSPYIAPSFNTPTGNRCGYSIEVPADDPFLGGTDLVLDWPGGHGRETTAIQEQMAYWVADRMGLAFSHRHFIRLHVNGVTDMQRGGVFEAVLQPGGEFLRQWAADDSGGEFFKIDRAFEFNDSNGLSADPMPRLEAYRTTDPVTGAVRLKTERYRWTWLKRSYDRALDYGSVFRLVEVLNAPGPEPYTAQTEAWVDVEQWMGMFAFEHLINNFDSWGHIIGKNMYAYKPGAGRWQIYAFDLDWLMLVSTRFSSAFDHGGGPLFDADDPTVTRLYGHPPFRRAYWRAVEAAVRGPFDPSQCEPVMDEKYASLVANGVTMCDGSALTHPGEVKTWFRQRRAVLQGELQAVTAPFGVSGPEVVRVATNVIELTGTAPVAVARILVGGAGWPVTWTTVTNWAVRVPLGAGVQSLRVEGVDGSGAPLAGMERTLRVEVTGAVEAPEGNVVLTEIMAVPAVAGAEYVELHNRSRTTAFDLSGWALNGLDYSFPPGSRLGAGEYLVLARDRGSFHDAHGVGALVFDEFGGNLQSDGETLTLWRPGGVGEPGIEVAKVRYEMGRPWPEGAAGTGASLQLVDADEDPWRAGNWAVGPTNGGVAPRWVQFTTTGTASSSTLYIYLQNAGTIHVDDVVVVAGTVPGVGANLVANGDFESPLAGTWSVTSNFAGSGLSTEVRRAGASSLQVVASAGGSGSGNAVMQVLNPGLASGQPYALSFWYLETARGGPLVVRLSGSGLSSGAIDPAPRSEAAPTLATPGLANSVRTNLPPFPPLWINEVQVTNWTGPLDRWGNRPGWVEVFNPSGSPVDLAGLRLSDSFADAGRWAFPEGATIGPGEFRVVFADGRPELSGAGEWHAGFRLEGEDVSVVLSREWEGRSLVLDYVTCTNLAADRSYGSFPDGQSFRRQRFARVTAGAANEGVGAGLAVFINEWMADNAGVLADPADGDYEDWFELFNAGGQPADLGGAYLTDALENRTKFRIPDNGRYVIPPRGWLVVWADEETGQNTVERPDLHVNFKLAREGEAIGLFAADGTPVDVVRFGPQPAGGSEGRSPDGGHRVWALEVATPWGANPGVNTPPELAAVGDRHVHQGQALRVRLRASDAESGVGALRFSLGAGAPEGVTVEAGSGVLEWWPPVEPVPAAYVLTVRVRDDGEPALEDEETFVVRVGGALRLGGVEWDPDGLVRLVWEALPGHEYRVESKGDLNETAWEALGPWRGGQGGAMAVEDVPDGGGRRFYRLTVRPL